MGIDILNLILGDDTYEKTIQLEKIFMLEEFIKCTSMVTDITIYT